MSSGPLALLPAHPARRAAAGGGKSKKQLLV
jgi:hypothetical protein